MKNHLTVYILPCVCVFIKHFEVKLFTRAEGSDIQVSNNLFNVADGVYH